MQKPLIAVLLAACGAGTDTGTAGGDGASVASRALPGEHVHGVARNPGDGKVYLATHQGLFRYDKTGPVRVGPVVVIASRPAKSLQSLPWARDRRSVPRR